MGGAVKIVVGQRRRRRHTRRVYDAQTVAALTKLVASLRLPVRQALGSHAAAVAAELRELGRA